MAGYVDTPELFQRAFPSLFLEEELSDEGDLRLFRGRQATDGRLILVAATVADRPAVETVRRLEREFALADQLAAPWSAVPLALLRHKRCVALVRADPGGVPLSKLLEKQLSVLECLSIAEGLAAALAEVHARGLIHKDVKPQHVLVDLGSGAVSLTGFGLAAHGRTRLESGTAAEPLHGSRTVRSDRTLAGNFAGTLAYLAPEQTGRMNRSVDSRADLYALGVVLYEALTGTLPFTSRDPLELIHAHIARLPIPPAQRNPALPALLSDLVLKLLAKAPEDRYQTARGAEADLRRCLEAWEAHGRLESFPLGEQDVPDRLFAPEKLYGRERDLRDLRAAWDRAAAGKPPEMVTVSGYSGVGKSSLVNALRRFVIPAGGLFAAGKFDQYHRGIPYATLAEALRGLVRSLLGKPDEEVARWRSALARALGPNGRVITDMVPELEHLLGAQPPVPELAPREAQNRFRGVFVQFLSALATDEHPLALFLDDLQWLDPATLELLENVFSDAFSARMSPQSLRHLLVVVAYRDNQVPESHPLAITLQTIRKAGAPVTDIVLSPLVHDDVVALVAEMLRSPRDRVAPLAELAYEKTGGNPFFLIHFVTNLHEEGLLFPGREGTWTWDLEGVRAKGYTDNVLDLMTRKLARLPTATQDACKALAMLGQQADLELLARVLDVTDVPDTSDVQLRAHLRDAERAGLVEEAGNGYAFIHDRIREAAYELIPKDARAGEHLRIGRLLWAGRAAEEIEDDLFELANHFHEAFGLLRDPEEQERVRRLFVRAGKAAKATTALRVARDYFAEASELLPANRWSAPYKDVFSHLVALAECEYLVGNLDRGNELFHELLDHARSDLDKSAVHRLHVRLYTAPPGTLAEALRIGLEGLQLLGVECPREDEAIATAIVTDERIVAGLLRERGIPDVDSTPEVVEPRAAAVLDLLAELVPRSSQSPLHMRWLTLQGLKICLRQGHAPPSAVVYTYYALMLLPIPGRIRQALAFSDLAVALNAKYDDVQRRPAVLAVHAGLLHSWGRPFALAKPLVDKAFAAAQTVWDRANGPASGVVAVWIAFEAGDSIGEVRASAAKFLDYAGQFSKLFGYFVRQYVQLLACLQGQTAALLSFDDAEFKEKDALGIYQQVGYVSGIWQFWALKLIAAVFFARHEEALQCVLAQRELPVPFFSTLQAAEAFFHALAAAGVYPHASAERQAELAATIDDLLPRLGQWAENCPENFRHRYQLVLAEKARIERRDIDAMPLYDEAIASARESGLLHMESLASELAGRFYFDRGFLRNAHAHLCDARAGYVHWGATAKVAQLDREFPDLERPLPPSPTVTVGRLAAELDLPHVIKASQALSGEIELDKLVETLLRLVLEQAGGDRGLLLVPSGDGFRVEAEANAGPEGLTIDLPRIPVAPGHMADSVFRYMLRTRERVLLDDAAAPGHLFSDDPYFAQHDVHSLLGLPLLKQSRFVAVLYLENRLAAKAFTPNRVAMLEVLASQAAIALENARLYADLEDERSRLHAVIQQVPLGLIIAEAQSGRLLVANETAKQMGQRMSPPVRVPADYSQYVGFHPDGVRYGPDEWPLPRVLRTGETVTAEEINVPWADGTQGWLSVSAAPIHDSAGRVTAGVAVFQDVTERHRREELVRASEERFAKAFHNNPTAMAVLRRSDWTFVDVNESFLSLLDDAREDVVGRSSRELGTWFRELLEQAGERLADGQTFRLEEHTAIDKAGNRKTLLVSFDTITIGQERCFLASFVDLTERKLVEDQLRQSQKMEAIGSLAGGVAHDFNNLLTAINGYSDLVIQRLPDSDPNQADVRAVRAAGERAAGLTRQLLAFSRKDHVETRIENLDAVVADMEGMLRRLIEENITLATRLDASAAFVEVNRAQVEQILLNLVVNARDAMPGGGHLRLETDRVVVEHPPKDAVLPPSPGSYARLTVRDTGSGIAPDVQANMFEPFFTTKGVGKGTGLGLSVVYGIMKNLGGGIELLTVPGEGTAFQIYFPEARHEEESTSAAPGPTSSSIRGKERILVVEDDEAVRTFISAALVAHGYEVVTARGGREALHMLERGEAVHVLLTDIVMPDLGGAELAKRARTIAPALPILFTSGYSDEVIEEPNAPAQDREKHFLAKPFGPTALARKLREILDDPQND